MVIPPKIALKSKSLIFFLLFMIFFVCNIKGIRINTLIKFLKKACSIGCMNWELNLISAAKIENKRHEVISNKIGNIVFEL